MLFTLRTQSKNRLFLEIVVTGCLAAAEADDCCPAVPLGAAAGLAALGVAVCCCLLLR